MRQVRISSECFGNLGALAQLRDHAFRFSVKRCRNPARDRFRTRASRAWSGVAAGTTKRPG
jgi:hypothetical protein